MRSTSSDNCDYTVNSSQVTRPIPNRSTTTRWSSDRSSAALMISTTGHIDCQSSCVQIKCRVFSLQGSKMQGQDPWIHANRSQYLGVVPDVRLNSYTSQPGTLELGLKVQKWFNEGDFKGEIACTLDSLAEICPLLCSVKIYCSSNHASEPHLVFPRDLTLLHLR